MALSGAQAAAYLDRIHVSEDVRILLRQGPDGPQALHAIAHLQRQHLKHVPFENLGLMYSSHHSLPQDTKSVFHHVVTLKRGGVCDQLHLLFAELLRYFGFAVYCAGSRINAAAGILYASGLKSLKNIDITNPQFGPWVHLNTIVTINGQDFVVDTGHGPSGFPTPVPLVHDQPQEDIPPRQSRMVHGAIPGWANPRQKWWRMQTRWADSDPWMDVWAFTETEWLPVDFQLLRQGYERMGTGWVDPRVCCFRTTYEGDVPTGFVLVIEDELRKSVKGKTELLKKLYSESDRVATLSQELGLVLSDEEQRQIIGHSAELLDEFDYYTQ